MPALPKLVGVGGRLVTHILGLYIHIPFCKSKCHYCDFVSFPKQGRFINRYFKCLEIEARRISPTISLFPFTLHSLPFTLYIGGGTPSLLSPAQLQKLFAIIEKNFQPIRNFRESAFEANPESLSIEKIRILKRSGITRISLGFQSANNVLLKKLGRIASYECFLKTFGNLRDAGFSNINLDIMSGLPGQDLGDFNKTLETAVNLDPEHISIYALEIHEGTQFFRQKIKENDILAVKMYESAAKKLKAAGYLHYEISNFAKPGRQSLHNLNYWNCGEYVGLGCSASSHLNGERRTNTKNLKIYLESLSETGAPALEYSEKLTNAQKKTEKIILGLRKTEGIELNRNIFIEFKEQIKKLNSEGLIEVSGLRIRLKRRYFYLSNRILQEFV